MRRGAAWCRGRTRTGRSHPGRRRAGTLVRNSPRCKPGFRRAPPRTTPRMRPPTRTRGQRRLLARRGQPCPASRAGRAGRAERWRASASDRTRARERRQCLRFSWTERRNSSLRWRGSNGVAPRTSRAWKARSARFSPRSERAATRPCRATTRASGAARRVSCSANIPARRRWLACQAKRVPPWSWPRRASARFTNASATSSHTVLRDRAAASATTSTASRSASGCYRSRGSASTRPEARPAIRRAYSCRPSRRRSLA